jgi:uncharacterized membrane-anchored protein
VKKSAVTRALVIAATLLVLGAVDGSIVAKERIKRNGEVVLLALAPVDPRSLMQGDYLALRFAIADEIPAEQSGAAALLVDERRIATLDPAKRPGALRIRYRVRGGRVWLGTNAYFFEENHAADFARARYGEFRVDRESGEAVLTGLRDAELRPLGAAPH